MSKNATSIKPGEVRNPKGRPKINLPLRELAQQHTEAAVRILVEIMHSKRAPKAARIAAANALLDRGYGRARQAIQFEEGRRPMTEEEMAAERKRILSELRMHNQAAAAQDDDKN